MRKILLILVLTISIVIGAWAQDVPQVINVMNRQAVSLNGDWHYIVDMQEEGYPATGPSTGRTNLLSRTLSVSSPT